MAYNRKRLRLGELLLENNLITEEQLNIALEEQKAKGIKLGEAIIGLGYVTQDAINDLLCQQLNIDFVDLRKIEIDDSIARMVGEKVCITYGNNNYIQNCIGGNISYHFKSDSQTIRAR